MSRHWHRSRTIGEAVRHAGSGLWQVLQHERNFRAQLAIYVTVLLFGWWLNFSLAALALVALAAGLIMSLELFNSAVERLSDVVSPQYHEGLRGVKDIAAGAVFVASLTAIVVGLLLFIPALLLRI
jgi:diacylglycerol kinase